jgi:hypothetical protein
MTPRGPEPAHLATFLTELAGFFEAADPGVDSALADHFGIDTAVDWAVVTLELSAEALTQSQPSPVARQLPGEPA